MPLANEKWIHSYIVESRNAVFLLLGCKYKIYKLFFVHLSILNKMCEKYCEKRKIPSSFRNEIMYKSMGLILLLLLIYAKISISTKANAVIQVQVRRDHAPYAFDLYSLQCFRLALWLH